MNFFNNNNQQVSSHVSKALLNNQSQSLAQVQLTTERLRFSSRVKAFNAAYPQVKTVLAGLGLFSFFMASVKGYQASQAKQEIQRRKDQLQQPLVNLTPGKEGEGLSLPWGKSDVDQWLYRPVQVTGRQLHYKAMLVPTVLNGQQGYEYIVPLVTKENEDGSQQEGILLNRGFYPAQYFSTANRYRLENSWENITFTGYVTKFDDIQHEFGGKGNERPFHADDSSSKTRVRWNNAYLPDMAKFTDFTNQEQVKAAAVSVCDLETPLDEKVISIYEVDATQKQRYPFIKRRTAALIEGNNPWEAEKSRNKYMQLGIASFGLTSLFILA